MNLDCQGCCPFPMIRETGNEKSATRMAAPQTHHPRWHIGTGLSPPLLLALEPCSIYLIHFGKKWISCIPVPYFSALTKLVACIQEAKNRQAKVSTTVLTIGNHRNFLCSFLSLKFQVSASNWQTLNHTWNPSSKESRKLQCLAVQSLCIETWVGPSPPVRRLEWTLSTTIFTTHQGFGCWVLGLLGCVTMRRRT